MKNSYESLENDLLMLALRTELTSELTKTILKMAEEHGLHLLQSYRAAKRLAALKVGSLSDEEVGIHLSDAIDGQVQYWQEKDSQGLWLAEQRDCAF